MYQVTKRDGTAAQFEIGKISAAITKAFEALEKQYHPSVIDMLALRVTADFEPKIRDGRIAVEDIQDSVEKVLSEAGYADVAKAYILYRKQREKVRNVNSTLLNYRELVDNYLQINDWRVKENSTVTYSVGGSSCPTPAPSPPTTGSARSTTRRWPTPTAMPRSISTTCPCSPATAPAGL